MNNVTVLKLEWMHHGETIDSNQELMFADKRRDACNVIHAKHPKGRSFNWIVGNLRILLYFISRKHLFTEKETRTQ